MENNARSARGGPAIIPHLFDFVNRQFAQKNFPSKSKGNFRQITQINLRRRVSTACHTLPQEFPHRKSGHSYGKCRDTF